jgi:hypothetical protein
MAEEEKDRAWADCQSQLKAREFEIMVLEPEMLADAADKRVKIHCMDFLALDPPKRAYSVAVWQRSQHEKDTWIGAGGGAHHETEQDALSAARELSVRTGVAMDPEIHHQKARALDYAVIGLEYDQGANSARRRDLDRGTDGAAGPRGET